jgi:pimeloyl-ACP methyl ester carboxylesterase
VATFAVADFLLPEGFVAPGRGAVLREARVVTEAGRLAWSRLGAQVERRVGHRHAAYGGRPVLRDVDPVVLVPGFMAGDGTLRAMSLHLRDEGFRTYRAQFHVNAGCTREAADRLERRLESIAVRRDRKVSLVGHSLGGMLAPKLATLDPKLAGIVVMSGNARPLEDLIVEQMTYLAKQSGEPDAVVMERLTKVKEQAAKVKDAKLSAETPAAELPLGVPAAYWLSFRGYEPAAVAAGLTMPVLVLSGERDYQVPAADFELWQKALAGKPTATLKRYAGLNHLFMAGTGPASAADYQKEGHVAEGVVEEIGGWVGR